MSSVSEPPCSDAAVKAKTGRNWAEWCALLDAEQAAALPHAAIATLVYDKFGGGPWWSQMVTVGYERLRGLRLQGQGRDGGFRAASSKTLPVAAALAHVFFTDAARRARWLEEEIHIRTATSPKSVRITWPDETDVLVWITDKGSKCSVAVEHGKLPGAEAADLSKAFWKAALDRLNRVVAAE